MSLKITNAIEIPPGELDFQFSRSGGPGGQNVNKVESRVQVSFNIPSSQALSETQKERLLKNLTSRIDAEGNLRITVQESRSQYANREMALAKLAGMLRRGLIVSRKRVATKPSRAAKEDRLRRKKSHSAKKSMRGRVRPE